MATYVSTFTATGDPLAISVHVGRGLPGFTIVGLPDALQRSVRDRLRAALDNAGFSWPRTLVTVNVPAHPGWDGAGWESGWDLAAARAILLATDQIPEDIHTVVWGELGLDGSVRPRPLLLALGSLRNTRVEPDNI
jgi:magnesium chelatase family protein